MRRVLRALMLATVVLTACGAVHAQPMIKVATFVPEKSVGVARVIKPWLEAVQAEVGDQATLRGFWGGTLGKSPFKQFELVKNGVADVSWVLPGYTAGQFPEMGLFELPFLFDTAEEASSVGWSLYQEGLLTGFDGVHVIGFFATEPNNLFLTQPITGLDQITNLKLRSVGAIHARWLEEFGASPQTLSSAEMNEGLNRGTIDGAIQGWTGMRTFKSLPLVNQAYSVPVGTIPFLLLMNKNAWDGLPKSVQQAVMQHGGAAMAQAGGAAYSAVGEEIRAAAQQDGKPAIVAPTAEQLTQYREQTQAVHQWWIEKTPNGQAVYDRALALLKALRG